MTNNSELYYLLINKNTHTQRKKGRVVPKNAVVSNVFAEGLPLTWLILPQPSLQGPVTHWHITMYIQHLQNETRCGKEDYLQFLTYVSMIHIY